MAELLMNMEMAKGAIEPGTARGKVTQSSVTTASPKTLSEMGISRDRSSQSQKLAKVPEDDFEDQLNAEGSKPSKSAIIKSSEPNMD